MDISQLLTKKQCSCGQVHSCDIKHIIIKDGGINEICPLTEGYDNILLVADKNTYEACGREVDRLLRQSPNKSIDSLVFMTKELLIPNEVAVNELKSHLSDKTQLIIGVGSGVIQDLCKYVSFNAKLPYIIVATAPSMDGYASKGAAMIMNGLKVTYTTHVPMGIIADTEVIRNAPIEMIKSGYGDIIGKLSCLNDWELSATVNNEYLCREVYDLTMDMTNSIKNDGALLLQRDSAAIKRLMEALVGVGIAMAYVGNSRPASGSEHHLSHFFEITGILENSPYFMHGTDVAFSTLLTCKMRKEIIGCTQPVMIKLHKDRWENKIRSVYGIIAEDIIALQNSFGEYSRYNEKKYTEKWQEIVDILKKAPEDTEVLSYLESIGLDYADFVKLYGEDKINNAKLYAKDLKDRYSVLWLYYFLFSGN